MKYVIALRGILGRPFIGQVATVASGMALAQTITLLSAPIVTRIYGPGPYGLQAIFTAVVSILAIVASMGFPIAIVLPKGDREAIKLAKLTIVTALFTSVTVLVVLHAFSFFDLSLATVEEIPLYAILVPAAIMTTVAGSIWTQWLVRRMQFREHARYTISASILANGMKIPVGFFYPSALVLIISNLLSQVGAILFTMRNMPSNKYHTSLYCDPTKKSAKFLLSLAKKYQDFPLLRTPQNLISALSISLPVFLLANYFGARETGQYSLAMSVLAAPAGLIGTSVMTVFYPKVNNAIKIGINPRALILKATAGMALAGIAPFSIIMLAGPQLFDALFGREWARSGEYASWLAIWLFFQFLNRPAVAAIPALRLQRGLLLYEIVSTISKVAGLYLGLAYFKSDIIAVAAFSVMGTLSYVWLILWVLARCERS